MKQKEKKTNKVKNKHDEIIERLLNQLEDAKREGNGRAIQSIQRILKTLDKR